jgi:D-glycero-alpha-D-manno-heptose-7-phosphate kinase
MDHQAIRIINSIAPIRVCDNGGWSDTWFARHGKVFSIAVSPNVEVQMKVFRLTADRPRITINAENYGERYAIAQPNGVYDRHPLIEAAMDFASIPKDTAIEVTLFSEAPPGCSTGTSAAVSVALLGALDWLTPGRMTPYQVAMAAFQVETNLLKQQCGIQDQMASAHGGINFIDMHEYPHAAVSRISIPDALWWELESRLVLIFVGSSHSSSNVHLMVIRNLEQAGMGSPRLEALRRCAIEAKEALYAGDLDGLGASMIRNTEAQAELHPDLVGPDHRRVIEIARRFGAAGWKVNGAGGDGGSVSILSHADRSRRREMIRAIAEANPKYHHIPALLSSHGLRVWETSEAGAVHRG